MALDFRLITGDPTYWNHLSRVAASQVTVNPAADALFPTANLYDGRPNKVFKWGSFAPNTITVNLDLLAGTGSLDTWVAGTPTGWTESNTGGASTVTEEAVIVVSGSAAAFTTDVAGGSSSNLTKTLVCRSGEEMNFFYNIRGGANSGVMRVRVYNINTQKYLNSSLAWQTAATDVDTEAGLAYRSAQKTFSIESYATTQSDTCSVIFWLLNTTTGGAGAAVSYADSLLVFPSTDVMGVFGHTIATGSPVEFHSSNDNFAANDVTEATASNLQPSFYTLTSATVKKQYVRLYAPVNSALPLPEIGELVFGQTTTAGRCFSWPVEWGEIADDIYAETPAGDSSVQAWSKRPRRTLGLRFLYDTHTFLEEGRDFFRRARGRHHAMLIIPDAARPEILLGRMDRSWKTMRTFNSYYTDTDITIAGLPFSAATL